MGNPNVRKATAPTSGPAIANDENASVAPLDPTIPVVPAKPSEADKARWRDSSAMDVQSLLLDPEGVKARTTAMVVIDYVNNGGVNSAAYFKQRLREQGLQAPGDKPLMAAVTVGTKLDRGHLGSGKHAAKILDEMASAAEGLLGIADERGTALTYTPEAVAALRMLILEYGYRTLADRARNEDIETKARGIVKLDPKRVQALAMELVRQRRAQMQAASITIAARDEKGVLSEFPNFFANQAEVEEALARFDMNEGLVMDLCELCQAAEAIALEQTNRMKVIGTDPTDRKAERRLTEAHIILRPDGTIVIGAHGTGSANVVHIGNVTGLLQNPPSFDLLLPPQVHKKLGLNLATADQRNAVEIEEALPAAGTTNVYATYRLRSEAAVNPLYSLEGRGLSFSWHRPTYGEKGDPEDAVADVRKDRTWNPVGHFERAEAPHSFVSNIAVSGPRFAAAASKKKAVIVKTVGSDLIVEIPDLNEQLKASLVKPATFNVHVAAADLRAVLQMFAALNIRGKVDLALDSQGKAIRWSFGHREHEYRVFTPCSGKTGTRLTDAFERLAVTGEKAPQSLAA